MRKAPSYWVLFIVFVVVPAGLGLLRTALVIWFILCWSVTRQRGR